MKPRKLRGGTHGLRKRCPCCGKVRKFFEPPGDQGGDRHGRAEKWEAVIKGLGYAYNYERPGWVLTPFGWGCGWCAKRGKESDARCISGHREAPVG
jgi:hypothetical protein